MAPGRCTRRPRLCLAALVSLGCIVYIAQNQVMHQWLNPTPPQIDKWKQCTDHVDGSSARPEWQWQGPGKPPLWIWYDPGADTKSHVKKMYDGHTTDTPCSDKNALIRYSCESWRKQLSHDFELRLVSTANVRSFFKGEDPLPPYFEALPFNHRSDFGSMALLAEHGGLYLDWDVLVLSPLSQYWSLLRHFEFVGIGGESHPGKGFLEHGLMMARPDNAGLRAGIAEALRMYQTHGGCAGQTCSAAKRLAGEMFMSTLGAFWPKLYEYAELNPCAFLRLPGVHYLPGSSDAISNWNYCKVPSDIKQRSGHEELFDFPRNQGKFFEPPYRKLKIMCWFLRFELEIVQHVLTKTVSIVHDSSPLPPRVLLFIRWWCIGFVF